MSFLCGPCVWEAKDVCLQEAAHHLSQVHVLELEQAVEDLLRKGIVDTSTRPGYVKLTRPLSKDDFQLPNLLPIINDCLHQLAHGVGWSVIRGLPVKKWSRLQSVLALHGIGLHLGRARAQNAKGHLIGHVKDVGVDPDQQDPTTRIYLTRAAQPWHCDSSDVVGLLCLEPALEGGMSSWASSYSAYNHVLRTAPELAEALHGPWYLDRKNEVPPGKLPFYCLPIVNQYQGSTTVYLNDTYYQLAQRHPEVPRITERQVQALEAFISACSSDELRVDHWLEPGDLQLLNNHCTVHTRTAFRDPPEDPSRKRHLLRLWVALTEGQACPLAPAYAEVYGSTQIGDRGGIRVKESQEDCIPLEAE
uniref:TauD/TfdA-like domain-containing protein n=1 Tax=Dunaliella tertiolecta TaxID=3047 RepID=A0A6S8M692_DUNTE